MSIYEYANKHGYGTVDNCLISLVCEWSSGNFSDVENEKFADKLCDLFCESDCDDFEAFVRTDGLLDVLFER